jgi:hypothetical protein
VVRLALRIGDAAHAMSSAGGQGASLALEDAMLVGQCLVQASAPIERVFAEAESRRAAAAGNYLPPCSYQLSAIYRLDEFEVRRSALSALRT